ncbi:MAG TPA: response regulator [Myxococcales bacterium]|jgi:signal transduction histidine kinase
MAIAPATLLLVDDRPENLLALEAILEPLGHRLVKARSGREALSFLLREDCSLILLDVQMPDLDGFETAALIRERPRSRYTPIIFVTAMEREEAQIIKGYSYGAVDYIIKPIQPETLIAKVRSFLDHASHERSLRREAEELRARERVALEAAEAQRTLLQSLFMQAPAALAILRGPEFVFELVNERFEALVRRGELRGKAARKVLRQLPDRQICDLLDRVYGDQKPVAGNEYLVKLPVPGEARLVDHWFNFLVQPVIEPGRADGGILILAVDVTESVSARQALEALAKQLQAADKSKDEFLAMLSHELRNPLSPILTALELMRLRKTAEGAERERDVIERQVKHLSRLVDDLLDVSRATNGKIVLRREPLELASVIANGVELARPFIEAKHHQLTVVQPEESVLIEGDAVRLAQVISNLLNNAAKYTDPNGSIVVEGRAEGDQAVICVRDNGQGMHPDRVTSMFDLFVQGDQPLSRSAGGLGVGLTLVRTLVQLHGGTVEANSAGAGHGSVFVVRLPRRAQADARAQASVAKAAPLRAQRKVLVVDDNVDAATTLAEALRQLGNEVQEAHDGQAALSMAARFAPDVILLDLGLPGIDGYEVARRLRAHPATARIRIVAVTGYGQEIDRRRTSEAGIEQHLVKPVDLDDVLAAVQGTAR